VSPTWSGLGRPVAGTEQMPANRTKGAPSNRLTHGHGAVQVTKPVPSDWNSKAILFATNPPQFHGFGGIGVKKAQAAIGSGGPAGLALLTSWPGSASQGSCRSYSCSSSACSTSARRHSYSCSSSSSRTDRSSTLSAGSFRVGTICIIFICPSREIHGPGRSYSSRLRRSLLSRRM